MKSGGGTKLAQDDHIQNHSWDWHEFLFLSFFKDFVCLSSIYFIERKHICILEWGRGRCERAERRERERIQADSEQSMEPDAGLDSTAPRSRPESKLRVGRLID